VYPFAQSLGLKGWPGGLLLTLGWSGASFTRYAVVHGLMGCVQFTLTDPFCNSVRALGVAMQETARDCATWIL